MKALLLKDYYNIRKDIKFTILIMAMIMILFFVMALILKEYSVYLSLFISAICGIFSTVLTGLTFQADEVSGWMEYALTTPVSRKTYLNSKYLFQVLLGGCGSIFGGATALITVFLSGEKSWRMYMAIPVFMLVGMLVSVLSGALSIPLFIRFRYQRALFLIIGMISACPVLSMVLSVLFSRIRRNTYISGTFTTMIFQGYAIIIMILAVLIPVVLFFLSYRWIEKKEF